MRLNRNLRGCVCADDGLGMLGNRFRLGRILAKHTLPYGDPEAANNNEGDSG
jgi:hypothetical protein